jgi:hypothetical protein
MAIEFVGGATASKGGHTSNNSTITLGSGLTGGIASSVSTDDLVIAVFGTGSAADRTLAITTPLASPYTLIGTELVSSDTEVCNLRIAYRFQPITVDTSTTFGPTGDNADAGAMAVYVFRGVDLTTPLDVTITSATGLNTVLPNPPSITPSTAGAYIVVVGGGAHTRGIHTFGSTELTDFRTVGSGDQNDATIGIGHKTDWTSGAFDPAEFTFSSTDATNYAWAAMSIALRPAAGGGPPDTSHRRRSYSKQRFEMKTILTM